MLPFIMFCLLLSKSSFFIHWWIFMEIFNVLTESNQSSIVVYWDVMLSHPVAVSKELVKSSVSPRNALWVAWTAQLCISEDRSPQLRWCESLKTAVCTIFFFFSEFKVLAVWLVSVLSKTSWPACVSEELVRRTCRQSILFEERFLSKFILMPM
jgi:hypothetical protein